MIAASEPQEYIPRGRRQVERHPGDVVLPSTQPQLHPESFLLHRLSKVAISDELQQLEWWSLRACVGNEAPCEEELYMRGKTAVWSRGAGSHRGEKVVLCCYTGEHTLSHVMWCTFHTGSITHMKQEGSSEDSEEPEGTPLPCLCLVDSSCIKVYTDDGKDYVSSLQFEVACVWPCKYGILLERAAHTPSTLRGGASMLSEGDGGLPTIFSLLHPLDEIIPVMAKHGGLSHMGDPNMKVVFTSESPSICMMYDFRVGLHSVWKIRKATQEENQQLCNSLNASSMFHQSSSSNVIGFSSSAASNASGSGRLSLGKLGLPVFVGENKAGSFASRTNSVSSHHASPIPSHSNSPQPTPRNDAFLSLSRGKLPFSPIICRASSTAKPWQLSSPACATPPPDSRLMTSQMPNSQVEARPLLPEVCLEHVWTENMGVPKDGAWEAATRVFLTTDLVGQIYLCYLIPVCCKLYCARMEKSNNDRQIIFGVVSSIVARDAVSLPQLHMIATVDLTGGVVLYSGMNLVGKVHVAGIPSALATSSYLSHFSSPFPKRSSLLVTSRPASADPATFEEELHLLSPVAPARLLMEEDVNVLMLSTPPRQGQLKGLRDAVDNRVTLELSDGSLFRISLPEICSSTLVSECLGVLKQVLQRDLAMQLLVRWYAARNAPGTQDICPSQEWELFIGVVFELSGYDVEKMGVSEQGDTMCSPFPAQQAKKKRASEDGSEEDWEYLLNSPHHTALADSLKCMLGLKRVPQVPVQPSSSIVRGRINTNAPLFLSLPLVLFSLHLLYENMKLNMLMSESLPFLAQLLYQIASDLRLHQYRHHYWCDFPVECTTCTTQDSQLSELDVKKLNMPSFLTPEPPSVFRHLQWLLKGLNPPPFPYISHVNSRARDIVQLVALTTHGARIPKPHLEVYIKPVVPPGSRAAPQTVLSAPDTSRSSEYPFPQRVVLLMVEMGFTRRELQALPAGIGLLLNEIIYRCRYNPPSDWPEAAYRLIMRQDLASLCCQIKASEVRPALSGGLQMPSSPASTNDGRKPAAAPRVPPECEEDDGMEGIETEVCCFRTIDGWSETSLMVEEIKFYKKAVPSLTKIVPEVLKLRFSKDHRVSEVRRLLQSSHPVRIAITQRPEVSDHEFIEEQERHLYAICTRTMALPVGRGMFTMRTSAPVVTEALPIPRLCLTGRAPPRGTTVDLSHIEVVPNMNLWPLFHNGVAAGLRILPNASDIESAWIVLNKPKGASEVSTEHAGFLMALGLNGHLDCLARWNAYEYLVKCHEMTSVGLLLGVAATKRGTMDVATTKMLSLHLEALLPPTSIELDIQQNIQVAALLGVGLVYQGTAQRRMAEVLLSEIGRPPGPEMENSVDRESYSLAAGLALGLVVLGRGSELCGLSDLAIPDMLHYYMVGGHRRPFTGSQKEKYKSPSYQIREGDSVNIDVTSPGATLALGMMFFNTKNRAVANWMKASDTQYLLDFVRPDFLLLRIVARSLILWDEIEPTTAWVESNIPDSIRPYCLVKPRSVSDSVDYETMNQAYCNILAGACMALGLRFAGSANTEAFKTLFSYAKMFTSLSGKSIAELAGKSTIETCLNVILLSLAMVMAGSGDLDVLRLCRHLRARVGPSSSVVTYGSHLATHMALGLLFLGGGRYSLATSPAAVAAMICAFFPKFPTHSNDNRYHLQAFRHLYVLAVEPRLLLPRDIDSGQLCYVYLRVVYLDSHTYQNNVVRLKAPCILPELSQLKQVTVDDDRYWTIDFQYNTNWDQLKNFLEGLGFLDVKQHAGCLSYLEDPQGFRSLLAQNLTNDTTISWSVKAESISAFSSDPGMVHFSRFFLELEGLELHPGEIERMQVITMLAYECVTQDKLALLPIWTTLLKALHGMSSTPSVFLTWQLKLMVDQVLQVGSANKMSPSSTLPIIVSPDLALTLHLQICSVLDSWEQELVPLFCQYLDGKPSGNVETLHRLASYLTYNEIPSQQRLGPVLRGHLRDPLSIYEALADIHPSARMLSKLESLLKKIDIEIEESMTK